ncbi:chemotaxis protein CheC [Syntrophomonas wolfei]|uniref:chemotaxis protein CheC n=1 Tax=Syntrophomonas wolfei TaxID=863 RepID=UPI000AF0F84F|nr:chemotaxis protein CheC [Syntrophomonas wolfei]
MVYDFSELSGMQLDILREIGNIGSGNAATALAQLLNAKIDMNVPQVNILPFAEVPALVGGADLHVVGLFLVATGSAPASILFLLPVDKACLLVDMLMGKEWGKTDPTNLSDMDFSALMELGNIICATYLNALAVFTQLDFRPSVPALGIDMAGAILNAVLAQFGAVADHVLVLETEFKRDEQEIVGHFFLLPEPGSLDVILASLGVSL